MWDYTETCKSCQERCCQFKKNELYFAPVATEEEVNVIKSGKLFIDCFEPHNNSKNVFQAKMEQPKKGYFVCPYQDKETHLCRIYESRPIDCRIWPLVLMKSKDEKKSFLTHVMKEDCDITKKMTAGEFQKFINGLESWFTKEKFEETIAKFPGIIWTYDKDWTIIRELKLKP